MGDGTGLVIRQVDLMPERVTVATILTQFESIIALMSVIISLEIERPFTGCANRGAR